MAAKKKILPDLPLTPAQQALVADNLDFVYWYAGKHAPGVPQRHPDWPDLEYRLIDGLIRAAQLFDPARGFKFITYAGVWMRSALAGFARRKDRRELLVSPRTMEEEAAPEEEAPRDRRDVRKVLASLRKMVPSEQWAILVMRAEGWSLQKVGDAVGKSKERVRQLQAKALARLRKRAGDLAELL
jgi:RNA polymerase sigma factor (sigma-70 family)